ncbi:MAG: hypothetical protein ABJE47_04680, partial [bacterium]
AAELDALSRLSKGSGVPPERLAEYRWAAAPLQARLRPITISPAGRHAMVGVYETVELRDSPEGLRFYRSDRPKRPQGVVMVPLDDQGLFEVPGYDDLRARVTATELVLMHGAEDAREVFRRKTSPR